jgi:hypothetical protein
MGSDRRDPLSPAVPIHLTPQYPYTSRPRPRLQPDQRNREETFDRGDPIPDRFDHKNVHCRDDLTARRGRKIKAERHDRRWNIFDLLYLVACIFACGGIASWSSGRFGSIVSLVILGTAGGFCFLLWFKYGHLINRGPDDCPFEDYRLVALFPLGRDLFLGIFNETTSTGMRRTHLGRQFFRKTDSGWKISIPK